MTEKKSQNVSVFPVLVPPPLSTTIKMASGDDDNNNNPAHYALAGDKWNSNTIDARLTRTDKLTEDAGPDVLSLISCGKGYPIFSVGHDTETFTVFSASGSNEILYRGAISLTNNAFVCESCLKSYDHTEWYKCSHGSAC